MHINELRDLVGLDRRAVAATRAAVSAWDATRPELPTPCAEWTIRDLVAHMTVQHRGFARAAGGERTVRADWEPTVEPDPIGAYRAACDDVLAAFGALDDPDAPVLLPELHDQPLPARLIVGFHLVDDVVHAWDVANAVGVEVAFDDDVLSAALRIARAVPDDERRGRPGAAFGPALPVPDDADALTQTLLLLGRDPAWTPA